MVRQSYFFKSKVLAKYHFFAMLADLTGNKIDLNSSVVFWVWIILESNKRGEQYLRYCKRKTGIKKHLTIQFIVYGK